MTQIKTNIRFDDFEGDDVHLVECINALLDMDDDNTLVPHGLGKNSHAYRLLAAAQARLFNRIKIEQKDKPLVVLNVNEDGSASAACTSKVFELDPGKYSLYTRPPGVERQKLLEVEDKAWNEARELVRGTNADMCKTAEQTYRIISEAMTDAVNNREARTFQGRVNRLTRARKEAAKKAETL